MPKKRRAGTLLSVTGEMPVPASLAAVRRQNTEIARARRRTILRRTAAARAELDTVIAGADMTSLEHLPIITGLRPAPVAKPKRKQTVAPAGYPAVPDPKFLRKMAKKPRPTKRKVRSLPTSESATVA
jgi:hypothetical protein